jgi:uncharacterized cupin superfamily protein
VSGSGWRAARLEEVPSLTEPGYWDEWTDDPGYADRWRSVRGHLGVSAFGVNACEAAAGQELVVRHDETGYGDQEELYFVHRGRARFEVGGEEVELGESELLYVRPEVVRQAWALETPTIVLMVGGTVGRPYEAA